MYGVLDRRDNVGPREVPIFVEGAGGRSSGRIVGEVCGVDPEGVPVQFLPVAESDRTETAAQTFPHGDSTNPQISPTRWNRLNGQAEVCLFPC